MPPDGIAAPAGGPATGRRVVETRPAPPVRTRRDSPMDEAGADVDLSFGARRGAGQGPSEPRSASPAARPPRPQAARPILAHTPPCRRDAAAGRPRAAPPSVNAAAPCGTPGRDGGFGPCGSSRLPAQRADETGARGERSPGRGAAGICPVDTAGTAPGRAHNVVLRAREGHFHGTGSGTAQAAVRRGGVISSPPPCSRGAATRPWPQPTHGGGRGPLRGRGP